MPLYEYECNTCGATFERITRFSEAANAPVCPECGSADTQKRISTIAGSSGFGSGSASSSSGGCGSSGSFS